MNKQNGTEKKKQILAEEFLVNNVSVFVSAKNELLNSF